MLEQEYWIEKFGAQPSTESDTETAHEEVTAPSHLVTGPLAAFDHNKTVYLCVAWGNSWWSLSSRALRQPAVTRTT
jgi:hypothetical protein